MDFWKLMVGAIALMWGTRDEVADYERQVTGMGGTCSVEQCTQHDIDTICRRMW